MSNKLIASPAPHVHGGDSIDKNMMGVVYALLPALLVSIAVFGLGAIVVTLVSIGACMLTEWAISRFLLKKKPTLSDGSALLTGLLLAFNLPSNLPLWIVVLGAVVAIGIGKMSYGGLGTNIFNPALVGRVFLLISFPEQMTTWALPNQAGRFSSLDATTGATPLSFLKQGAEESVNWMNTFFGFTGGSLGEVSAFALLLGFAYLLIRRIITWHIPVSMFLGVILFSFMFGVNPILHLLTGGVMLGAIFMATDYVTSPMTHKGMLIYGFSIGAITMIIRYLGAYPEGVSFAILIMNAFTPLINQYIKPKRFGERK